MLNKRGVEKINLIVIVILSLLIVVSSSRMANAGPYGYGNSMELKYSVNKGTIIYGYENQAKYQTSLKPEGLSWSIWTPKSRREVISKTWGEIFGLIN
jgi:hypothetical protein